LIQELEVVSNRVACSVSFWFNGKLKLYLKYIISYSTSSADSEAFCVCCICEQIAVIYL
jgi:hypothetical protein